MSWRDHGRLAGLTGASFASGLLLWATVCVAQVGAGDELAARLRQNVVRIQSHRKDATENGFGFVVGERTGRLYIVTAYHVVADVEGVGESTMPKATVTFYSAQGHSYDAQVLDTHKLPPHDLAVLTTSVPQGLQWIRKAAAGTPPMRGTAVWSIARGQEWQVQGQPGAVSSDRPSADQIFSLDGLKVLRGSSGGPVVSSAGIVGMILSDSADDTRALTIGYIKDSFLEWNYPWSLESAEQRPASNQPGRTDLPERPESGIITSAETLPGDRVLSYRILSETRGKDLRNMATVELKLEVHYSYNPQHLSGDATHSPVYLGGNFLPPESPGSGFTPMRLESPLGTAILRVAVFVGRPSKARTSEELEIRLYYGQKTFVARRFPFRRHWPKEDADKVRTE